MANRAGKKRKKHRSLAGSMPVVIAQVALLMPLVAAAISLSMGAAATTVMLWIGAATVASATIGAWLVQRVQRRVELGQYRLDAERRHWKSKALTDPLTTVANRRGIESLAQHQEAKSRATTWTVLNFDVDHFKTINDFHGHPVGDRALCLLASTLKDCCPVGASVGRLGGDEFVAFTNNAELLDERWAKDFCRKLASRSLKTREGSLHVVVTYGRATGAPGETFASVSAKADDELIATKAQRRATSINVIGLTDAEMESMRVAGGSMSAGVSGAAE